MPFIRYETGDMARFADHGCPCGRTLPLLAAVHGQAHYSIVLPGGRRLHWPFFHQILNAEPEVMQWQEVQTGAAEIVVKTICRAADMSGLSRLKMAFLAQCPQNVRIEVQPVDSIPLETNGKLCLTIHFPV